MFGPGGRAVAPNLPHAARQSYYIDTSFIKGSYRVLHSCCKIRQKLLIVSKTVKTGVPQTRAAHNAISSDGQSVATAKQSLRDASSARSRMLQPAASARIRSTKWLPAKQPSLILGSAICSAGSNLALLDQGVAGWYRCVNLFAIFL